MNEKKKKKREPNCALCLCHGIKVKLKGHKRHCEHRDCTCAKCKETKARQEYMADMQYIKRNGIAEEARLGKRADMIAIYNERMKNKSSKKKELGLESEKPVDHQSITLQAVDSNIQDLLRFFRGELKITEDHDILFHSLVVMLDDLGDSRDGSNMYASVYDHVVALYKDL